MRAPSRLQSVDSSYGYKVTFSHTAMVPGIRGQNVDAWLTVVGASVTDLAGATGSALASNSYSSAATTRTITDPISRVYQYTMIGNGLIGIRLPGSATDDMTIGYTSGRVTRSPRLRAPPTIRPAMRAACAPSPSPTR